MTVQGFEPRISDIRGRHIRIPRSWRFSVWKLLVELLETVCSRQSNSHIETLDGRCAEEIRWFVCELQSLDPQSFRYD
ncbi:hypothetical protein T265_08961 [Opisthorchis viverrini]|uniref:Uncharacterized protein n=1 Tax=Opisthorchis viverrini TaxID=6198 RepID=A0A074Z799_OPIVI|nr:hypothetical protein T265_08961 [Opisthorchis viverrini]KER23061.1 hypothetical protein T265_08961 [Opisthorchis viverrini]